MKCCDGSLGHFPLSPSTCLDHDHMVQRGDTFLTVQGNTTSGNTPELVAQSPVLL